jgi:peptidyl-prolyl cis-trans isomerase C
MHRHHPSGVLVLLCGLLALQACAGDVVAVVNEEPITRAELRVAANIASHRFDPVQLSTKNQVRAFKTRVLNELIDDRLVIQTATRAGLIVDPVDFADYVAAHKGRYNDASFHAMLEQRGVTESVWQKERERQYLIEAFVDAYIAADVQIDDAAIQHYYHEYRSTYTQPEAVSVRQILTDNKKTANAVYQRLLKGDNFAQLAIEYSISPESERGGDLGWIERGQYPTIFEETCFRLPIGAMSDVVKSRYGYHIFKVTARRRAGTASLADVREVIALELRKEAISAAFAKRLEQLRERATIAIRRDAVDRVTISQISAQ